MIEKRNSSVCRLYTRNECLLDCRVKDIIKMCGCLPIPFAKVYKAPDCLLEDLNCLFVWTKQWMQARRENINANTTSFAEPKCPHCLRRCNYVRYLPSTSKADFDPFNHNKMSDRNGFLYVYILELGAMTLAILLNFERKSIFISTCKK